MLALMPLCADFADGDGVEVRPERKRELARVDDDAREGTRLREIVAEPLERAEVRLADVRAGLDLDAEDLAIVRDEIFRPIVESVVVALMPGGDFVDEVERLEDREEAHECLVLDAERRR